MTLHYVLLRLVPPAFVVLVGATALASGGPVDQSDFNCKAPAGELVTLRLHQATSSETRGDVLLFKSAPHNAEQLTQLSTCAEVANATVTPPVDADVAGKVKVVACGSRDTSASGLGIRPNNAGFRATFWKVNGKGYVRVQKNGQVVFGGDLGCLETPL